MIVSLIVAASEDGVIGRDGGIPWRLSSDLRRFKQLTMGHHLVMGRKTFESLGRVLPGRTSIVLSRQPDFSPPPGVLVARDIAQARQWAAEDEELFVIGGAEIYQLFLPQVDRIYLTRVQGRVAGDTYIDLARLTDGASWRMMSRDVHASDEKNEFPHVFEIWERVVAGH
jgi:dihydrofolate reductase